MKPDDPAFGHGNHEQGGDPGLTKREYIAIQAMQGLLSGPHKPESAHVTAEESIRYADALIAALQETSHDQPR